jgi:molybdopterin/thiamine biosynthesis adenylyltransferase
MGKRKINRKISLRIDERLFKVLKTHLFPGDDDEHAAVIAAGIVETKREIRLLARKIFLAEDGKDYVPGKRSYRTLTGQFVAEKSDYCCREKLCYIAVHCHPGSGPAAFSSDDLESQRRGYPALVQMTGRPIMALVLTETAAAGNIWTVSGVSSLSHLTVVGSRITTLTQSTQKGKTVSSSIYDRHARLFGDAGQDILSNLKVVIIGLGGGGSLVNEWLSRLGVGHIVAIDHDKAEPSNLPRIVGATYWDAMTWLTLSPIPLLQRLGRFLSSYKVKIAKRLAMHANPKIKYEAVAADISEEQIALKSRDADFIFLATDTIKSRNVFNALVHQYLIPGAQIGAKVTADKDTKEVVEIFTAGRMVMPYAGGGCLQCNGLIPSVRLQKELLSEEERRAGNYVENEYIQEPSVITLNVLSASQVVNDFLLMFTGLYQQDMRLKHVMSYVLSRERTLADFLTNSDCTHCSDSPQSRFAKGDVIRLPCRRK